MEEFSEEGRRYIAQSATTARLGINIITGDVAEQRELRDADVVIHEVFGNVESG